MFKPPMPSAGSRCSSCSTAASANARRAPGSPVPPTSCADDLGRLPWRQNPDRKVLSHAITKPATRVNALVFVGDCIEEKIDELGQRAGELGLLGVPVFMFHEGHDPVAELPSARSRDSPRAPIAASIPHRGPAQGTAQGRRGLCAGGRKALEKLSAAKGGKVRLLTSSWGRKRGRACRISSSGSHCWPGSCCSCAGLRRSIRTRLPGPCGSRARHWPWA